MGTDDGDDGGMRARVAARSEEALGKVVTDLLENQMVSSALSKAFEARGKAAAAQELAMGFLNIPSATDIERLTRRLRAVSQRLETIEDAIVRVEDGIRRGSTVSSRLDAIEQRLATLSTLVEGLHGGDPRAGGHPHESDVGAG